MSKTNDSSRFATLKDHRPLADSELDAVSGGWSLNGIPGAVDPPAETPRWNRLKFTDVTLKGGV